jgi:hypothetical protein
MVYHLSQEARTGVSEFRLRQFDFQRLFVEELGWSQPLNRQAVSFAVKDNQFFVAKLPNSLALLSSK